MSEKTNKVCVNIDQSDEQNGGFSDAEKLQARTNIGAGDGKVAFVTSDGQQQVVERSEAFVVTNAIGNTYFHNLDATKKFLFLPDFDNTKYGKYAKINEQGKIVWDDAPTGLPTATQQDAGKALILDANGEPIWSDSIIDTEYSFGYNGNLRTERIKKLSAIRCGYTMQGYDHDILAIKSNVFSGVGGNNASVEKEYELLPHDNTEGFVYSNGYGLSKKKIYEIFVCEYGVTTYSDAITAINQDKVPVLKFGNQYSLCSVVYTQSIGIVFYSYNAFVVGGIGFLTATLSTNNVWSHSYQDYITEQDSLSTNSNNGREYISGDGPYALINFTLNSTTYGGDGTTCVKNVLVTSEFNYAELSISGHFSIRSSVTKILNLSLTYSPQQGQIGTIDLPLQLLHEGSTLEKLYYINHTFRINKENDVVRNGDIPNLKLSIQGAGNSWDVNSDYIDNRNIDIRLRLFGVTTQHN